MGESKRRKQIDPNYGKPKPKITIDSNDINEDVVKALGAEQPPDDMLPPAITWGIQIEGIHDYQQLFTGSLHFINRGLNPAKYVFTTEQFNTVLQSLIDEKILIFEDGGYHHHPDVKAKYPRS